MDCSDPITQSQTTRSGVRIKAQTIVAIPGKIKTSFLQISHLYCLSQLHIATWRRHRRNRKLDRHKERHPKKNGHHDKHEQIVRKLVTSVSPVEITQKDFKMKKDKRKKSWETVKIAKLGQ